MFVMRAAVGVEANPWTGGKVALAYKEFSNTAEVSRKVREDSILREILSRGLPSVCCYLIFQAALDAGQFAGFADFLILDESGRYQVWDTKLARAFKPYYAIQLCCYAEMLAAMDLVQQA